MAKISDYALSPAGIFDNPLEWGLDRLSGGLQLTLFTFIGMFAFTVLVSLAKGFIAFLPTWFIVPIIVKNFFILAAVIVIMGMFAILVIELILGLFADGEEGEKNRRDFVNSGLEIAIAEWFLQND